MVVWNLIKTLVPKTLWGQLVALLILALLVSQAITLALFIDIRQSENLEQSEEKLVSQISQVLNGMGELDNGKGIDKDYFNNSGDKELKFRTGLTPIRGKDDRPMYSRHFTALLVEKLNNKSFKVRMISEDRRDQDDISLTDLPKIIKISVEVLPDAWVIIERREVVASLDWIEPLIATMLLMIFFIIIIVSWLAKRLTKPLAALSEAAQSLGRGQEVEEIPEMGTADIKRLITSFNQMNEKTSRFVSDRTQLLAAISHDLRTPITSLRLRAESIQDKKLQEKIIPIIEEMREMTESTLQFSKDSNKVEKTNNVDMANLLETLTEDYQDMDAPVELIDFGNHPQIILPMRMQSIKRAFRNLIDNGLKYGQEVNIDFKMNKHTNMVEIAIRDKGPGIDSTEFNQVFEPFYRIEKSRNKDTGGVGLGLSITRGIIQAHGGEILLSNILDGNKTMGLEVKVLLPVD